MQRGFSEQCQSFWISEVSKDSQLLSLFMDCQAHGTVLQMVPQPSKDLCPQDDYYFKGFWSEQQGGKQGNRGMRKQKQIINKKDRLNKKKRTKIYIQMLQNRVLELQGENEKLIKLNKTNKQYIHKLNESEHHINGYFIGRQQVFEQLEKMNSETSLQKQKIVDEVISLRMRQGAYGKDRIKAINYYFKEMVEMLLPEIQKYLLKITLEKSDFFDTNYISTGRIKNESEGWRQQLFESLESDHQSNKLRNFLNENQSKLEEVVLSFKQMIQNFYNLKCELIKHSRKIEQAFDGCHKHMSIKLISKTLCYIDRYRFQKGISLEHTLCQIFDKAHQESYNYNPDNPFETVY